MHPSIKVIQENKLGERPSWDEYFMKMAISASSRSSCFKVHAGSIITFENRIIGTGYNGAPPGVKSCLERGGCHKEFVTGDSYEKQLNIPGCIGVHSEMNALAHVTSLLYKGATIYTTIFPCVQCSKTLLAYGIKRIVFKREYDKREIDVSMKIFSEAGVEVSQLDLSKERIIDMDFNTRNAVFDIWSSEEKKA